MIKDKSILIKNIYYMLSYAFQTIHFKQYENIEIEEFDNIHNLFSAILSRGISYQLKQGLYKEYVSKKEDLPLMRGKINVQGTIKNRLSRKQLLSCEYDELSENNLLNQIIKTTSVLLIRHSKVDSKYKDELKKEMLFFQKVDTLEPKSIRWSTIVFQRNNQNYRILISICQLVIQGMLLTTEKGQYKLLSFIKPEQMHKLYEKFLLEYFAQTFPNLSVKASQIPWALEDNVGTLLPIMQTDITIEKDNKVLIIDAKYYTKTMQVQFDKATIRSNHLYQIFTYVKNKEYSFDNKEHIVSGMLLYAKTDEVVQPDNTFRIHDNEIKVKNLDLNQDFSKISESLNSIVKKYFDVNY